MLHYFQLSSSTQDHKKHQLYSLDTIGIVVSDEKLYISFYMLNYVLW